LAFLSLGPVGRFSYSIGRNSQEFDDLSRGIKQLFCSALFYAFNWWERIRPSASDLVLLLHPLTVACVAGCASYSTRSPTSTTPTSSVSDTRLAKCSNSSKFSVVFRRPRLRAHAAHDSPRGDAAGLHSLGEPLACMPSAAAQATGLSAGLRFRRLGNATTGTNCCRCCGGSPSASLITARSRCDRRDQQSQVRQGQICGRWRRQEAKLKRARKALKASEDGAGSRDPPAMEAVRAQYCDLQVQSCRLLQIPMALDADALRSCPKGWRSLAVSSAAAVAADEDKKQAKPKQKKTASAKGKGKAAANSKAKAKAKGKKKKAKGADGGDSDGDVAMSQEEEDGEAKEVAEKPEEERAAAPASENSDDENQVESAPMVRSLCVLACLSLSWFERTDLCCALRLVPCVQTTRRASSTKRAVVPAPIDPPPESAEAMAAEQRAGFKPQCVLLVILTLAELTVAFCSPAGVSRVPAGRPGAQDQWPPKRGMLGGAAKTGARLPCFHLVLRGCRSVAPVSTCLFARATCPAPNRGFARHASSIGLSNRLLVSHLSSCCAAAGVHARLARGERAGGVWAPAAEPAHIQISLSNSVCLRRLDGVLGWRCGPLSTALLPLESKLRGLL
jgi:hypothetical protein